MFTWICQQCGRECQPSWTECPDCVKRAAALPPPSAAPPQPPLPPQPQYAAPQPQYAASQPPPPPYSYAVPAPRQAMPAWLMTIIFALAFGGLVGGAYYAIQLMRGPRDSPAASVQAEKAPAAEVGASAKGPHPLLKHIEIVGIRINEDAKKKTQVRFVIVNHSGAEITDLSGRVHLIARTAKAGEAPVGTLTLKTPSLGPYESKEVSAALDTNLRAYELPDWQNVSVQVEITSPQM